MIVTSNCAIKHWNLADFLNSSSICPHKLFSFQTLSLCFVFYTSCNSSHLLTNSINSSSISEAKQAASVASKHSKCSGGDVRLFALPESSRYTQSNKNPELEVTWRTVAKNNLSRFSFPIFAHSWRFSVFHSLQSITPRIYLPKTKIHLLNFKLKH